MPNIEDLERWLREQLGFEPVAPAEIERVERSVKQKVAEPALERLSEQQDELEEARTWYLR
jgi:hypothetical protein